MVLLELFWAWFQIGLFSIGGGYAALPIIKNMVVDNNGWLTGLQFTDLVIIDQMAPGPIILNSATFTGARAAGFAGAAAATAGCITGPAIIVFIIAKIYFKNNDLPVIKTILSVLRPVVVALIASAGLSIIIIAFWGDDGFSFDINSINFFAVGITVVSFAVLRKFRLNPVFVILGCGVLGGIIYCMRRV